MTFDTIATCLGCLSLGRCSGYMLGFGECQMRIVTACEILTPKEALFTYPGLCGGVGVRNHPWFLNLGKVIQVALFQILEKILRSHVLRDQFLTHFLARRSGPAQRCS